MALAWTLVFAVVLTAAAVSFQRREHDGPLQSDALPVQRLERLELLMERYQTLTENLLAENQGLKSQMEDMQRELASVKQQQQQQQSIEMKSSATDVPVCRGGRCLKDAQNLSTLSEHETGLGHNSVKARKSNATSKGVSGLGASWNSSRGEEVTQSAMRPDAVPLESWVGTPSRHVPKSRSDDHLLKSRSDDFGSLEVEVSRLAQTVTGLTADVQALQTSNTQLQSSRGSSFVQWGSSTCSGSAQLVYSGVLGGSLQDHTGAASNALCLTMNPVLLDEKGGYNYNVIYGGEYETGDSNQDKDPVCAVCRTSYQTTIMIPGTNVCSSGWTKQYSGYLMAGHYSHVAATEFICVDSKLESEAGSNDNHNGHLLYFTHTQCGSLPCSPYINNKVMTCAVCSK